MSSLQATAVVTVLLAAAAAAAGSYFSTPLSAGFLSSPAFLWVAANVIIIWLFSSSCRANNTAAADASPAGHAGAVLSAVDDLYPSSSEYESFSDVGRGRRADAPVSKRQAREARAARRTDRPRVRKKPAGEDEPSRRAVPAETRSMAGDKRRGEEMPKTVAAAEVKPDGGGGDDDDVDLDSAWQSIVQRRAARPVPVRKRETWGNDELPRAAETAAERRDMRKSVSAVNKAEAAPPPPAPSAARQLGWRTREVLVMAQDELLRRAESLIRRHHANLRLQRQESEQRQAMEMQRGHRAAAALIRV